MKLSQKNYLACELERLLAKHLVTLVTRAKVLAKVTEDGYIDDTSSLEMMIQSELKRGKGPKAIALKLRRKGMVWEEAKNLVASNTCEEKQKQGIRDLIERRYNTTNIGDVRERRGVINALIRKGYEYDTICQVLDERLATEIQKGTR
jgi:SOS response regulatory protein OraA/RecX